MTDEARLERGNQFRILFEELLPFTRNIGGYLTDETRLHTHCHSYSIFILLLLKYESTEHSMSLVFSSFFVSYFPLNNF